MLVPCILRLCKVKEQFVKVFDVIDSRRLILVLPETRFVYGLRADVESEFVANRVQLEAAMETLFKKETRPPPKK